MVYPLYEMVYPLSIRLQRLATVVYSERRVVQFGATLFQP